MKQVGTGGQQLQHPLYVADGSIAEGGTPQLVLPRRMSCSHLLLQNTSNGPLVFEIGSARATAVLTGDVVTSFTVTNAGFGFTYPPIIQLLGGGNAGNSTYLGLGLPGAAAPSDECLAIAVMTGTAPNLSLSSIAISRPGSKYVTAPYVYIRNSDLDPNGCAVPSATSGILLPSGSAPLIYNGTVCPTEAVAVFGATTGQTFVARWMD